MPISRHGERSRWLRRAVAAAVVLVVTSALAKPGLARDRVSLPFTCVVDNGKLKLEPGGSHSYQVVGPRDQQSYTFCPSGEKGSCRTWNVQRFSVQCQGGRATWPEIVAVALRSRATIEKGQLMLRLVPNRPASARVECKYAIRGFSESEPCLLGDYLPTRAAMRNHVLAMPKGFAPLGLVNARIVQDQPSDQPRVAALASPPTPAPVPVPGVIAVQIPAVTLPPPPPPRVMAVERTELAAPAQEQVTRETPLPASPSADRKTTTASLPLPASPSPAKPAAVAQPAVNPPQAPEMPATLLPVSWTQRAEAAGVHASRDERSAAASDNFVQLYGLMLLATILLALTGIAIRQRRTRRPAWIGGARSSASAEADGERAVALRDKAEGHIALISRSLDRLAMLAPLRNALARDLQASERRLAVVVAAISTQEPVEAQSWTRARRRLERISHDLDRLQQIADSAVTSLSGINSVRALPRNRDEAYLTLGVTPGVSDAILKRLVEALRISWHPDLAQNDADREARDVRIKEINVAWDLITGKRESE